MVLLSNAGVSGGFIAKDQDAEYVECLDCGAILEAEELGEPSGFDESLSDA
jgi:hypothetical protein